MIKLPHYCKSEHILKTQQQLIVTSLRKSKLTCLKYNVIHCIKSVRIRSYSGPYFPAFGLNSDIRSISPYSGRMWENTDQNNSEYGHFSRSNSFIDITKSLNSFSLNTPHPQPPALQFFSSLQFLFQIYVRLCAIWYHLNNFKNVKNTYGGVLLLLNCGLIVLLFY